MSNLDIKDLAPRVAVLKPTVVGAAVRIFLLGGSRLDDKARGQAAGSAYLMRENGEEIMGLVEELEARTVSAAKV